MVQNLSQRVMQNRIVSGNDSRFIGLRRNAHQFLTKELEWQVGCSCIGII